MASSGDFSIENACANSAGAAKLDLEAGLVAR